MQVKSIEEACSKGERSAILSTFIKQSFSIKTFVLSISKWPLKTGFTVSGNFYCLFERGLGPIGLEFLLS